MPTQLAATTSSKGPAKQSTKDLKKKQPSIPNRPTDRTPRDDNAIWEVDGAHSEEEPQTLGRPRQPAKAVKRQEVRAPKANETKVQTTSPTTRPGKGKPAPTALSQPRTRRTAAIKANKRIQGLDESDEIEDDDEIVLTPKISNRHTASRVPKAPRSQKIRGSNDGQPISGGRLSTQKPSTKDFIPDRFSAGSSKEQPKKMHEPESILDAKANIGPENVDLVIEAPAETLQCDPGDAIYNLTEANPITAPELSVASLHSDHCKHTGQPQTNPLEGDVEVSRANVNLAPDSVPELEENINDTEPISARSDQDHDRGDLGAEDLAGPGDQDHVEDVLPYIDNVSLQLRKEVKGVRGEVSAPRAPTAPMVVESRQRRTSPRLAEAAQRALPGSTTRRGDPFGAKLNALMPKFRDASAESKRPKTPDPAERGRPSRDPKARAVDRLGATSLEDAKQVEDTQRHLKTAIQEEGEGEDSLFQTYKHTGELTSASGTKAKRKIEQSGDTSHKRVKLAPREQPEGASTSRKSAYDAEKTPPPVVSNKPLVIGFSTTGPRNQGTISTKKPNPPNYVGTGAPSALKSRVHNTPYPTINQVELGFASVREAVKNPSEDIQYDLENAGGAQTKALQGSPQPKKSEHIRIVKAIATPEANTQGYQAQKRKFAPFVDDPALWEHDQFSKRQKRDIETPPTAHTLHPKMLPNPSPTMFHDRSQRLSSQNTRVNENGSPMPFLITRNDKVAADEQYLEDDDGKDALAEARLEEQLMLHDDDPMFSEPVLPLRPHPSDVSISHPKTTVYKSLSNNSKQVPSSPHAPSAFGMMPPHHIYHDGEIVNAETKEPIIPVKPQDPFLGAMQYPQNSFMDALRKSAELAAKHLVSGANVKRGLGGAVKPTSLNVVEDPDKTLVEPDPRKNYKQVHASHSSPSSQSGSCTQASQHDESSDEESDTEIEARWRSELEPHQENMLECLLTISHVSEAR